LLFHFKREANKIGLDTKRGLGNIIITTADVASALELAGKLDTTMAVQANLETDFTVSTFAGVLDGRFKVYIDPYIAQSAVNFGVVGYKGSHPFDAGLFYCPYVPLQMVRAVGENSFQPKIGFCTRYGLVSNPFANAAADGSLSWGANKYYRKFQINKLNAV